MVNPCRKLEHSSSESEECDSIKKKRKTRSKQQHLSPKNNIASDTDTHDESDLNDSKPTSKRRKCTTDCISEDADFSSDSDFSTKNSERKNSKSSNDKSDSPIKNKVGGRREIRHVLKKGELTEETKDAEKREKERRKRLEKAKKTKNVHGSDKSLDCSVPLTAIQRLVLQKDPVIEVHPQIAVHLKPHQLEGIQFVWDNLIETSQQALSEEGGGCILAHCMGLGKTLQTISFVHTVLTNDNLPLKCALVVVPFNTVLNWIDEFRRWTPDDTQLQVVNLHQYQTTRERLNALKLWKTNGGVMVLGYDMFRILASGVRIQYKAWKKQFVEFLLDPGPDLIVCDEGHKLKNSGSSISLIMSKIKTKRRLVLTGTPLQNNLMEYQCMVNFVKPNLLGSVKEFRNRFVNPIQNGQHSDSTPYDVRLMKKRCHVLHDMLRGFVLRKDYTALASYLCSKLEYIVKVRLTPLQIQLYRTYLDTQTNRGANSSAIVQNSRDTGLFTDYQNLMRVWTHPRVLRLHTIQQENANFLNDDSSEEEVIFTSDDDKSGKGNKKPNSSPLSNGHAIKDSDDDIQDNDSGAEKKKRRKKLKYSDESDFSSEDSEDDSDDDDKSNNALQSTRRLRRSKRYRLRGGNSDSESDNNKEDSASEDTFCSNSWYSDIYKNHVEEFENIESGGKLTVLFEILNLARQCDDKVLVFSQSLLSLNLIEEMLAFSTAKVVSLEESGESLDDILCQKWYKNVDYFRIDGSSIGNSRQRWMNEFNNEEDRRARLFLISTKAGSLGVNLVAANRVVIFDASWNPTHDIQSIFRVYRFGQKKPCFIYRLIAQGTMEEKIYDRQVSKQSLSFRVVDEQQINRYYTAHDLEELYNFTPSPIPKEGDPEAIHALPKDKLLAELLVGNRTKDLIASYHTHDSLLDHQETEELTEEERKAAWEEFEKEKRGYRQPPASSTSNNAGKNLQLAQLYQRQLLLQQQQRELLLKQLPATHQDDAVIASLHRQITAVNDGRCLQKSKQTVLAMLMQVYEAVEATKKKMQHYQPVSIEDTIRELRAMPMYAGLKEDAQRMLAFEMKLRRQQLLAITQNDYKRLEIQMNWLSSRYKSMISTESTTSSNTTSDFTSSNLSNPLNQSNEAATSNSSKWASNVLSMQEIATFARSSFSDMLKKQEILSKETEASTATNVNIQTPIINSEAVDLTSRKTLNAVIKNETEKVTIPKCQSAKPSTNSTRSDLNKMSKTPEIPTSSNLNKNKPTTSNVTSGKSTGAKRISESSDDDVSVENNDVSDEDDDWEIKFMEDMKARSRRTRK